ncbi:hypothetical protein V6N11_033450 [Hibiscus sabdariffa]|uniref:Uncharacterized protein n=1 Tax=Hibiscus sabdariffa TaxID=183260 RepID=A0ABR2PYJ7_9ROSI
MEEIGKKIAKEDEGKQEIFTIFVENILEAMVWKVLVLITTTVKKKICEVVEVEVGDLIYTVRVEEKGFSDTSIKDQNEAGMDSKRSLKKKVFVLASESSSDSSFRYSPAPNFSRQREEYDAFNAVMMGKESSACFSMGNCSESLLGEMELMGEGRKKPQNSGMEEKLMEKGELEGLCQSKIADQKREHEVGLNWAVVTKEIVARSRKNKELDLVSGPGVEKLSNKSIYGIAGGDLGQDQHVGIRLMGDGFQGSVSSAVVHKGLVVEYIGVACDCLVDAMSACLGATG